MISCHLVNHLLDFFLYVRYPFFCIPILRADLLVVSRKLIRGITVEKQMIVLIDTHILEGVVVVFAITLSSRRFHRSEGLCVKTATTTEEKRLVKV